jgi:PAS domain S-box-containing protein
MSRIFVTSTGEGALNPWIVPLVIGTIGIFYQMTVGGILAPEHGYHVEFNLDLILFGIVNPILAFWAVRVIRRTRVSTSHSESRARKAELLLAAINDVSPEAIIRLDGKGQVVFWNKAAELLFGNLPIGAKGRAFEQLFDGPGEVRASWQRIRQVLAAAGEVRGYEMVCHACGGEERVVEVAARNLKYEGGESGGMLIVLRDITHRKQRMDLIESLNHALSEKVEQLALANAELKQAELTRGEMLSVVAHDIRAPLVNLLGGAEQLRDDCAGLTESCSRMFHLFYEQAWQLDGLVRRILDAASIEAGRSVLQREPLSLTAVTRQVVDQFRAHGGTRPLQVSVSPDLPYVDADRDRVADVLANLLTNADKYSPTGAEIAIEAEARTEWVTVRVRDHGPGLPPSELNRVFDKFYRADTPETRAVQGYGLGLYICRQLVTAHGGTIRADNNPQGGAIFSFTLPVVK